MTTDEHKRWRAMDIRRPDDVRTSQGGPVPIGWQAEKRHEHTDRLGNNSLPADFPYDVQRGTAGDSLTALALGESMRRDLAYERAGRLLSALELGATWSQIAAALDVTTDEARALLTSHADGQHHLYRGDVEQGRARPFGMGDERHAAVLALCELEDDEPAGRKARVLTGDGRAGWLCDAGASYLVDAMTDGPGRLGTMHGVIYVCADHRKSAQERITGAGYRADVREAPPGHKHDPWPCGHVTAHSLPALAALADNDSTTAAADVAVTL